MNKTTVLPPRSPFPYRRRAAVVLLALAAWGMPPAIAAAQVCGDVNASGSVTSADALGVLRYAVGQDVELTCSGDCASLDPRVTELEDALALTQENLSDVQDLLAEANAAISGLQSLLAGLSRTDTALVLSGANFQVVDGTGATAGPTNGLGNIIVGYNERTFGQDHTGSHNLVVGEEHSYSSFGGIVAGERNTISARAACVLGGEMNVASGLNSSVCGGSENVANAQYASVGGGFGNEASGLYAAVSGGCENMATNTFAAVSGGRLGVASGQWGSVTGGYLNKATGTYATVSGGSTRTAGTTYNWKAGSLSEAN